MTGTRTQSRRRGQVSSMADTATCMADHCDRPSPDGTVCTSCLETLTADLRSVPALMVDLELTLTRQVCMGDGPGPIAHSHADSTRMPVHLGAAEAAMDLRTVLLVWAGEIADTAEHCLTAPDTARGYARWLLRYANHIRQHPAAVQLIDEVRDAITRVRRVIDRPPERLFFGRCGAELDNDGLCTESLYGYAARSTVVCPTCGTEWGIAARRAWLLEIVEDEVAYSGLLAGLVSGLGVPIASSTIRNMAKKGRIRALAVDARHRPLYRIGDVLDVCLRRTRASQRG